MRCGNSEQQERRSSLRWLMLLVVLLLAGTLTGCVASRSEIKGAYTGQAQKNLGAEKVSAVFIFRHLYQYHGFDIIPKLSYYGVKDFDNLFRDALKEISNISRYDTYTELSNDVNDPERRQQLETLRNSHDYTLDIRIFEETSFKQQFLSGTIGILSLTLIPVPFSWDYTFSTDLYDKNGKLVRSYQRKATLNNWVEAFLLFAYPFHPLEEKREIIYSESLHDIFRQIEAEKVLKM